MNSIAQELNQQIQKANPHVYEMLSDMGKALFFPKGILSQSAEAKEHAHRINATIGIAREKDSVMSLSSVASQLPDLPPDEYLPYAPSFGIPELRQKWHDQLYKKNPGLAGQDISLPVVTCGITHGISLVSDLWVNPGDVLVLPDMIWGNYRMIFSVKNQAKIVHYATYDKNLTCFNVEDFKRVMEEQAKTHDKIVTILNFPHNPSGYSLTKTEAEQMAGVLLDIAQKGTRVVAVVDDAYFGLFFDEDTSKESLFAKIAGKHERLLAIKLDGATKEDYVWGLRVGCMTYGVSACDANDSQTLYQVLEKKTAGCIRGTISNVSHLSQRLVLTSMNDAGYEQLKQEKFDLLKSRAVAIKEELKKTVYAEEFLPYPFNSGYFMCIRLKHVHAEDLRQYLLKTYGVGLIATADTDLRIAFSCLSESQVTPLFETIFKGIRELKEQSKQQK